MEIDVLSPQLLMRSTSNKRARSPSSPSPRERALKRPVLVHHEPVPQLAWNAGVVSGFGTRRALREDEYAHQTGGLTLRCSALGNIEHTTVVWGGAMRCDAREDVQMNGPDEVSRPNLTPQLGQQECNFSPPILPPPSDIDVSAMGTLTPHHSRHYQDQLSRPSSPPLRQFTEAQDSIQPFLQPQSRIVPPHITLQPATPSEGQLLTNFVLTAPTSSTPSPTLDHTPSSPTSVALDAYPSSPLSPSNLRSGGHRRRQLLSMGPRADCEKCRLRVPGHWMHFD
ncbi:hypothetical protein M0805_003023 [Coniferiporia weirii]|nr:hypothetical protein M0805_003023 [Coniferiporia weirii]